jgi:hypothetical protein
VADFPWGQRVDRATRFAKHRHGSVSFAVVDEEGKLHGWHRGRRYPSASVVKVMLMVAYLNQRRVRGRRLHRGDRRLLKPMIRRSDDNTASAIYSRVGDRGLRRVAHRAGMRRFRPGGSVWGLSQITARDQARFMLEVDSFIPRCHRGFAMRLLTRVVRRQRWGIPPARPDGWTIHFKGGFVGGQGAWRVHQVALLTRGERRLSLAVLSNPNPTLSYGAHTIRGIARRLLRGYE